MPCRVARERVTPHHERVEATAEITDRHIVPEEPDQEARLCDELAWQQGRRVRSWALLHYKSLACGVCASLTDAPSAAVHRLCAALDALRFHPSLHILKACSLRCLELLDEARHGLDGIATERALDKSVAKTSPGSDRGGRASLDLLPKRSHDRRR